MREHIKTVGVYTRNDYLFQKIKLSLHKSAATIKLGTDSKAECDVVLVDADDPLFSDFVGLKMKRIGGDIPLPFSIDTISSLIDGNGGVSIKLSESEKTVWLGAKIVKLTELEFRLLDLLVSANGTFVSRERILNKVWEDKADAGIINVYIHYLREKLETDGEKIILSSRNYGYKINEKYIGGTELC